MSAELERAGVGGVEIPPFRYGRFTFSQNGLACDGKPEYDEWDDVGHVLAVQVRGLQLQVGDWLRIGEKFFGEKAAQVIDAQSWSESTVRVYRHVAGKVPMENRMIDKGLSYAHHQAVAALAPRQQKTWLMRALGNGDGTPWPVSRLKAAIRAGGDEPETGWWVLVSCSSAKDQEALVRRMEMDGRTAKPTTRRGGEA